MSLTFETPSQVGDDYLTQLKSLKPEVNTSQTDSEWYIRSRVLGGFTAGFYSDQLAIADDAFPQRARHDALARFLDLYFSGGFIQATQAQGNVIVTGTPGVTVFEGLQFLYSPNGNVYQASANVTLDAPTGVVPVISVSTGQGQNLLGGAPLTISSPPPGIQATATVIGGLSDARDPETDDEARARIIARIQEPLSVGRVSDYVQYAEEADPSVTSASVVRYPFGLGTVGVYITSGTTNIDQAINNGETISIFPSPELIATVQAFLDINSPVTDCVTVLSPTTATVNVTVKARYVSGDGSTILTGQTLTQDQLVAREVKRAIYKTPVGGRVFNQVGYVLASEIAETIDVGLSDEAVVQGTLPILSDRQVLDLSPTGVNLQILASDAPIPGTINIISF